MNKLIISSLVFLISCAQNIQIKPKSPNSKDRVTSVHQNLTYSMGNVVVTDEMDPIFQFMYESKIAAPASDETIYGGITQSTGVSLLPNNKMIIVYNTRTEAVSGGIDIVDISNIQAPVIIYSYVLNNLEFSDSKFKDSKAYLTGASDEGSILITLDLSDLANPTIVDNKRISSYYATSLSLLGNNLLVSTGDSGDIYSFNLNSGGIPQQISHESFANLLYVKHHGSGYVALHDQAGKTVLTKKDSSGLESVALRNVHFESPARFDIDGQMAYISTADEQHIERVDLSSMTRIQSIPTTGRGNGLRFDSGLLYTAQGEEGFKLFDVRPGTPTYKGRFNFDDHSSANNIWTFNLPTKKVIVLADGLGGVKIISQDLAFLSCDPAINHLKNGSFEEVSSEPGLVNGIALNHLEQQGTAWDVYSQIPFWFADTGSGIELQTSGVSAIAENGNILMELDSQGNSQLGGSSNTKVSQLVALNSGNYIFKFMYKARVPSGDTSSMKVLIDDIEVASVNILDNDWHLIQVPATLSIGTHKISIMGAGLEDSLGALIDNAALNKVCN